MKKIIWPYGVIAGFISCIGFIITLVIPLDIDMAMGMVYGYASMLLAFSLIFVAIKNYRDKHNNVISFGKAFRIGLYITLIASTIYVLIWLVNYFFVIPDFMEKYTEYYIGQLQTQGIPQAVIETKKVEMEEMAVMYKNPFFNAIITYTEILPVGLLLSLIAAVILKRKPTQEI